jgi:hypothetical protein
MVFLAFRPPLTPLAEKLPVENHYRPNSSGKLHDGPIATFRLISIKKGRIAAEFPRPSICRVS